MSVDVIAIEALMIRDSKSKAIYLRKFIGGRIADLRRDAGMSQVDLSRLTSFTAHEINDIETGLIHLTSSDLLMLCRVFKVEAITVFSSKTDGEWSGPSAGTRGRAVHRQTGIASYWDCPDLVDR